MSEAELNRIARDAAFIVKGYAFSILDDQFVSILNLEHPESAMVVNRDGEMIETNMDPVEQQIVLSLCKKNLQFLEA